jgi:hypothetical protein
MISEFAIDPELFARWSSFQTLSDDFGIEKGRMISEFPRKWKNLVRDRALELAAMNNEQRATTDLQALRIVETIFSERFGRVLKRSGREFRSDLHSWREAASHASPAFDVIVAAGSGKSGNYIGFDDLLRHEPPFHRKKMNFIDRKKEDLIAAAAIPLTDADEVILVDPNFRADEPRFYETLNYLLDFLKTSGRCPKRLELHTKRIRRKGEVFSRKSQEFEWNTYIVPFLSNGLSINVCFWDKLPSGGKPHARFLLTQSGGLYYDEGIDEGKGETLVTLLEDHVWASLFKTFDARSLPENFEPAQYLIKFPQEKVV